MLHKTEIAERDILRQALEAQVNEYLSSGGKIDVRPTGETRLVDGMRNRETQERISRAVEQERRAHELRFEREGYA